MSSRTQRGLCTAARYFGEFDVEQIPQAPVDLIVVLIEPANIADVSILDAVAQTQSFKTRRREWPEAYGRADGVFHVRLFMVQLVIVKLGRSRSTAPRIGEPRLARVD